MRLINSQHRLTEVKETESNHSEMKSLGEVKFNDNKSNEEGRLDLDKVNRE